MLVAIGAIFSTSVQASETTPLSKDQVKSMNLDERMERVLVLEERVLEIQNIVETQELAGPDKRALKKELRKINKEMKLLDGGGIYISAGAIIIILLLIIII